jgi:hypothetical protein
MGVVYLLCVCRSLGKIVSTTVPSFEAASRTGVMEVVISNTGTVTADYGVSVCRIY